MKNVPLSVLDLSPVPSGGDAGSALRATLDLARRAEQFGYHRYWVAEHHFAPGVVSSQPALLLGQIAAVTGRIRLGSGAVQTGHQTPLSVVEQFGLLDALYPGRFDLGLGRSGRSGGRPAPAGPERVVDGLLIPEAFSFASIFSAPRFGLLARLLQQPGATTAGFAAIVDDVRALLAGPYTDADGNQALAVPGAGADLRLWILGSSGGESARVAGERGLPFVANYHVAPSGVLDAVTAYREAFRPSAELAEPYVMVSADVVVAPDDAAARRLAEPYRLWVRSIRTGAGAIPYPTPEEADAAAWTERDEELVADRLATRFVGSPATVAERLDTLRRVTGADELLVTTITHDHADRVRSYALLASQWDALSVYQDGERVTGAA